MDQLLRGARSKIKRANKHIIDLNSEIIKFFEGYLHIPFIEHDPQGPGDLLKVGAEYPALDNVSLVLGDFIHNLRSSLDLAINEIEFICRKRMTPHTKFPIYPTREKFIEAVDGGFKEKVPFKIYDFIFVEVEPYAGGNSSMLWGLHVLDIEDKHRIMLVPDHIAYRRGIVIRYDDGRDEMWEDWQVIPDRIAQDRIVGQRNAQIADEGQPLFEINFGKGLPFEGKPIIPTCYQLMEAVSDIVDRLAGIMDILIRYNQLM